jgi:hypothetical protein
LKTSERLSSKDTAMAWAGIVLGSLGFFLGLALVVVQSNTPTFEFQGTRPSSTQRQNVQSLENLNNQNNASPTPFWEDPKYVKPTPFWEDPNYVKPTPFWEDPNYVKPTPFWEDPNYKKPSPF